VFQIHNCSLIDYMKKPKIKAAVLLDGLDTKQWAADALRFAMERNMEVTLILHCTNSVPKRRPIVHAFYYLLNIFLMKGPEERSVSLRELGLSGKPVHRFLSVYEGSWQTFPPSVRDAIAKAQCDVVVKLGMGLLRNPDTCGAQYGVLSFHHGDPSAYRGRPAGFYEILHGKTSMGMMVQRLSNALDAGQVLAFGRSRVIPYSYRQTLAMVRRNSIPLLTKSIEAVRTGQVENLSTSGPNYRLPGNLTVVKFLLLILCSKIKRLNYGLFWEKTWRIARSPSVKEAILKGGNLDSQGERPASPYSFYADGFFLPDGSIIAEAMRSHDGKGEIVRLGECGALTVLSDSPGHHWSYPFVFSAHDGHYLLPEVADWSPPFIVKIDAAGTFTERTYLKGLEDIRLVDPTLLYHNQVYYIFAGKPGFEADQLHLWYSETAAAGPYIPHPASPIVINPGCARMGGQVVAKDGRLYRLGQNNVSDYGDGLTVCEVEQLDINGYRERIISSIRVTAAKGPHTLNFTEKSQTYDFYTNKFSLLAGYRRLRARF